MKNYKKQSELAAVERDIRRASASLQNARSRGDERAERRCEANLARLRARLAELRGY